MRNITLTIRMATLVIKAISGAINRFMLANSTITTMTISKIARCEAGSVEGRFGHCGV